MARRSLLQIAVGALLTAAGSSTALAQSTEITYQGQLKNGSTLVNSPADFRFSLFTAASGGTQVGFTSTRNAVTVTDGLFTTPVDFGIDPYTSGSQDRFLQIEVRSPAGVGSFVPMGTRQALRPAPFSLATRGINVVSTGGVGIGTTSPQTRFHVVGDGNTTGPTAPYGTFETTPGQFGPQLRLRHGGTGGQDWVMVSGGTGNGAAGAYMLVRSGSANAALCITSTENVGIGNVAPDRKLGVSGGVQVDQLGLNNGVNASGGLLNTNTLLFGNGSSGEGIGSTRTTSGVNQFGLDFYTGYARRVSITGTGNVGIGTTSPLFMLDVNGEAAAKCITIKGGCDLVEGFDSQSVEVEPGTLMVIDPAHPGQLMPSTSSYDSKVAGIVSGAGGVNPGIKLSQEGVLDGKHLVAMTGRVYVKATAANGAIQPGDRLTTSSVPGHAMKATDGTLADGAVIGKAMSGLDKDTGLVLVLVNLQ